MADLEKLVTILNAIDNMYGIKEYNYSVIENDNEAAIGIAQYGAEIDPLDEFCEAQAEIRAFIGRLHDYSNTLREVERQIELDREYPELED